MLHNDRLTLAILLCRIHLKGTSEQNLDAEFSFFLRNRDGLLSNQGHIEGFTSEQIEGVYRLSNRLPVFKTLVAKIKSMPDLIQWLQQSSPEQCVPELWEDTKQLSPVAAAMHRLLLIQAFRPDRVIAAGHILVSTVLGEDFMPLAEKELDFSACVEKQLTSNTPALLCSVPGFDASGRVDDLAAELNKRISSIAIGKNTFSLWSHLIEVHLERMFSYPAYFFLYYSFCAGSAEGFSQAERAINAACKAGHFCLLKVIFIRFKSP